MNREWTTDQIQNLKPVRKQKKSILNRSDLSKALQQQQQQQHKPTARPI